MYLNAMLLLKFMVPSLQIFNVKATSKPSLQFFCKSLALPVILSVLILSHPESVNAASGGRMGGGSFRARPSIPLTRNVSRTYSPMGGGIGFPFLMPIFGFGGGGMFSFLIFMAILGVLMNGLGGTVSSFDESGERSSVQTHEGPVTILQVRIGLLASARDLQTDLRYLASTANTGTNKGLQRVLQDTTLALLRQPNLWVYANTECGQVPFIAAESTFNRLSMAERSKLRAEITSNVDGYQTEQFSGVKPGLSDVTSEFIAVTILIACKSKLTFKGTSNAEDLQESLRVIGSIPSDSLIALEIIWQPDGAGEVLSTEELLTTYPDLQHL
uniref:DUF1517 domain-containing protein n=1 Tax=Paulinella longichromatophora TaxID=1708747 RepID=A0A2H4ZP31_9EUKA|nr:hypothetical protein PLO_284 [Paulinella longichromatophora]